MELIKVKNENGKQLVSARELYDFLGLDKTHWKRWSDKNIVDDEGSEVLWVKAVEDKEGKYDGCIFFCCELYYQFEKTKKKL